MDWMLILNAVLVFIGIMGAGLLVYGCWAGVSHLVRDRHQSSLR